MAFAAGLRVVDWPSPVFDSFDFIELLEVQFVSKFGRQSRLKNHGIRLVPPSGLGRGSETILTP